MNRKVNSHKVVKETTPKPNKSSRDVREPVDKLMEKLVDEMANTYYAWGDRHTEEDFRNDLLKLISLVQKETREEIVGKFRDLIDEFNEMKDDAPQFEVRIRKPVEFARRIILLTHP